MTIDWSTPCLLVICAALIVDPWSKLCCQRQLKKLVPTTETSEVVMEGLYESWEIVVIVGEWTCWAWPCASECLDQQNSKFYSQPRRKLLNSFVEQSHESQQSSNLHMLYGFNCYSLHWKSGNCKADVFGQPAFLLFVSIYSLDPVNHMPFKGRDQWPETLSSLCRKWWFWNLWYWNWECEGRRRFLAHSFFYGLTPCICINSQLIFILDIKMFDCWDYWELDSWDSWDCIHGSYITMDSCTSFFIHMLSLR